MKAKKISKKTDVGDKKPIENTLPPYFRVCEFNRLRDVHEVEQGLAVDINEALRTGVVKENDQTLQYNNISEPSRIVGRISNNFDAIEAQRVIKKYGKKAKTETVVTAGAGAEGAGAGADGAGAGAGAGEGSKGGSSE